MTEAALETAIQATNPTAPRLTPEKIDAVIVSETYTVLPSGKVMVCELTLRNGFTVRGESAVVSKENFKETIGQRISRENARDKVWEVEGYLLQQMLHEVRCGVTPEPALAKQPAWQDVLGEAEQLIRTKPTFFILRGTVLENDVPVWIADFALRLVQRERARMRGLIALDRCDGETEYATGANAARDKYLAIIDAVQS